MTQSLAILEKLISYPTISKDSNLALTDFVQQFLNDLGFKSTIIFNEEKTKANLWATIGPADIGGVALSAHTDVVPVVGQDWSSDPFAMVERGGNF
jgi:acetylornithine deacetylase